ncbi:MAG: hypothetical protein KAU21_18160, partial [Gammaproteobacteria bacterium]|nr:hypothetical protein [Gammaproteobacteria bacterium]
MQSLLFISGFLALVVCAVGWRFVHQIKRKRVVSSLIWSGQGLIVFSAFVIVLLVYSNLHTYQRLTYEVSIADIYVRKLAHQKYQLSLSYSSEDKDQRYYIL